MKQISCVKMVLLGFFFYQTAAMAHGTLLTELNRGTGIQLTYDNGDPFAFSEVKVYAPDDSFHQGGYTDKRGCFVFMPDKPGEWKIEVSDGTGHGVVHRIAIENIADYQTQVQPSENKSGRIFFGLSFILFLSGSVLFYKGSKAGGK
ncbi:MAG: hypothetical protein CR997_01055 [Acidobacteria bacterium]|nr:MAG: hypothetical protein CR997_01055 [Acidobacteriota bacterium]